MLVAAVCMHLLWMILSVAKCRQASSRLGRALLVLDGHYKFDAPFFPT